MTFSNVVRFDLVDSTNRYVAEQAAAGADEGLVAIADEQGAGRGRLGRTWVAKPGEAFLCSLLFRPRFEPSEAFTLPMLTALAAADAAGELANAAIRCKWPNDLTYSERKLGGVLAEFVPGSSSQRAAVVVGIGVNLVWSSSDHLELDDAAIDPIGLREIAGHEIGRDELSSAFLAAVDDRYSMMGDGRSRIELVREYARRCETIGRLVRVTTPSETFDGLAVGLGDDGRLVVERGGKTLRLEAADVVHVRDE